MCVFSVDTNVLSSLQTTAGVVRAPVTKKNKNLLRKQDTVWLVKGGCTSLKPRVCRLRPAAFTRDEFSKSAWFRKNRKSHKWIIFSPKYTKNYGKCDYLLPDASIGCFLWARRDFLEKFEFLRAIFYWLWTNWFIPKCKMHCNDGKPGFSTSLTVYIFAFAC